MRGRQNGKGLGSLPGTHAPLPEANPGTRNGTLTGAEPRLQRRRDACPGNSSPANAGTWAPGEGAGGRPWHTCFIVGLLVTLLLLRGPNPHAPDVGAPPLPLHLSILTPGREVSQPCEEAASQRPPLLRDDHKPVTFTRSACPHPPASAQARLPMASIRPQMPRPLHHYPHRGR